MTRALRLMLRALAAATATVCVLMGIWHPSAASAVALNPTATYVYDGSHHSATSTTSISERGPRTAYNHDAVDRRSHGGSVYLDAPGNSSYTTYDVLGSLAQVDNSTGMTARSAVAIGGDLSSLQRAQAAANGGAASVRLGQAGENAVRSAFDIGPKATAQIGGRTRIFDGLNDVAVSEVKNVKYQAYTQQLKDSLAYAQQNGLRFDLYVRGGANPTTLSGPLEAAIRNGDIGLRCIP